jgi:hypothetical protein
MGLKISNPFLCSIYKKTLEDGVNLVNLNVTGAFLLYAPKQTKNHGTFGV